MTQPKRGADIISASRTASFARMTSEQRECVETMEKYLGYELAGINDFGVKMRSDELMLVVRVDSRGWCVVSG